MHKNIIEAGDSRRSIVAPKMNLPNFGQSYKVVYQRPKEKKMGRRKQYTGEKTVEKQ